MAKYTPVIGLEIHAELKTPTKMFCGCANDPFTSRPNTTICPVCTGQPGALPTINRDAVLAVLTVGMALNGDIPATSKFDRKNYFYPDLPKGYQISQYDLPLVFGGTLKGIRLRRIHLEEDTASIQHIGSSPSRERSASLVNFNRAGVPLMELVTEPDIRTSEQAGEFARELQLILRYLGISDADMEKGQMRVEANISLSETRGSDADKGNADNPLKLGTKVEVKNIASFKAMEAAIRYELMRQERILDVGEKVVQETRGWDDAAKRTVSQRIKEEAHDYRYFPEPDLPPLDMSELPLKDLKTALPELPQAKRLRLQKQYGLKLEVIEILIADRAAAAFFEAAASELEAEDKKHFPQELELLANYLAADLRGLMKAGGMFADLKFTPEHFAHLIELLSRDSITSRVAKDLLARMHHEGGDPKEILEREGLHQVSDERELRALLRKIIAENPTPAADYRKGKIAALQFFVGRAMGALKGKGNPALLQKLATEELGPTTEQ